MNEMTRKTDARDVWNITGSFGVLAGEVTEKENSFTAENGKIAVQSRIQKTENGICIRTGTVKNISGAAVEIYTLASRFSFDGGEYSVYSQYNGWQNESTGGWQPLVTTVSAHSESVRNALDAVPFMVLWSRQVQRGTAFHVNAYSAWEMQFSRVYASGEAAYIAVEIGVKRDGLRIILSPGEEMELPEILYYEVRNKTDFDAWKLHTYMHERFPRREMPVIYNTWLYKFAAFTFDDIMGQIKKAAEVGVEYFVIDAGWFGEGRDWFRARGDWEENPTYGFRGRMHEIAEAVRAHGMQFGFWLEPECASKTASSVAKHPEYYLEGDNSCFIDFANPEAADWIFKKTCALIDRYKAAFIKFDFNADLKFDVTHKGFTAYCRGHRAFVERLQEKYPDLYLENCASGGVRMALRDGMLYDSFWLSDNQSPYETLRIFKDTLLRLPPQWMECWISVCTAKKVAPLIGTDAYTDKLIATHDAKWNAVVGVHQSFLEGVMTGSPVGLSFDLHALSVEAFSALRSYIRRFKERRDFWKKAVCHILTDTETMLVLEFRNGDFSEIELVVFAKKVVQNHITVYPVLDEAQNYILGEDERRSAADIAEAGIGFTIRDSFTAQSMTLKKEDVNGCEKK